MTFNTTELLDWVCWRGTGGTLLQWFCSYLPLSIVRQSFPETVTEELLFSPINLWDATQGLIRFLKLLQGFVVFLRLFSVYMKVVGEAMRCLRVECYAGAGSMVG